MKRKVCVITGSRADYGLLRSLMAQIRKSSKLELQIIATGTHLSSTFGSTYQEIEIDQFLIDRKIECISEADTADAIATAISKTLVGAVKCFQELKPDILVLLGDRFEIFAAATAGLISRVPIAHIHGGEKTVGAFDEAFRHSITKMSHLHFVATEDYRARVIQLGEEPSRVFTVGGIGIDEIMEMEYLKKEDLEKSLGVKFRHRNLLVTFHPATLDEEPAERQMKQLLMALANRPDTSLIFTMPNADTGSLGLAKMISQFVAENPNAYFFTSLGRTSYLSCMALVDGVIGNSSSGIIEAPSLGVGTVNIGDRQEGRVQARSIINCNAIESEIREAIVKLYSDEFRFVVSNCKNPYGDGGTSQKISRILSEIDIDRLIKKTFYDL